MKKKIEAHAFDGCDKLESIIIKKDFPMYMGDGAFDNTNNCPIYVTQEEYYKSNYQWHKYADRIKRLNIAW